MNVHPAYIQSPWAANVMKANNLNYESVSIIFTEVIALVSVSLLLVLFANAVTQLGQAASFEYECIRLFLSVYSIRAPIGGGPVIP